MNNYDDDDWMDNFKEQFLTHTTTSYWQSESCNL